MTISTSRFGRFRKRGVLSVLLCSVGIGAFAQVQQTTEPSRLRFSVGAGAGDEAYLFSNADLKINRATRTQKFTFGANVRLIEWNKDNAETGFIDPRVTLSYEQDSGPLLWNVGYTYASTDIEGLTLLETDDGTISEGSLVISTGTRTNQSARLGLEYGKRGPFGAKLGLSYSSINYEDVTDPRLFESTSRGADLSLRFDINPVFQVNAGLGYSIEERENDTNTTRERTRASIGAEAQVNKVMRADADLRWTQIDTTSDAATGGRSTTTDEGLGFGLGLTIDQRNGETRFAYRRDIEVGGVDDRLTYSRSFNLTKTQSLSYSVGAIRQDGEVSGIGSLTFEQQLPNGAFQISASQSGNVTDLGNRVITRRLAAAYSTDLTARSSLSAQASFANVDYRDAATDDIRTTSAGVTYSHALTPDWGVSASVSQRWTVEGAFEDSDTNLSLSINRDFTLFR